MREKSFIKSGVFKYSKNMAAIFFSLGIFLFGHLGLIDLIDLISGTNKFSSISLLFSVLIILPSVIYIAIFAEQLVTKRKKRVCGRRGTQRQNSQFLEDWNKKDVKVNNLDAGNYTNDLRLPL